MATLLVEVTQDDIDRGLQRIAFACPLARSLERQTGRHWFVGRTHVRTEDGHRAYALSLRAREWIAAFDHGGAAAVQPTRFRLTTGPEPPESLGKQQLLALTHNVEGADLTDVTG